MSQLEKDEAKLKQKLSDYYDLETKKYEKEIAAYYQLYGENNVIEYRRLMLSLSDEDKALLIEDMNEFAEKYPQYQHLMPVRESVYKLNRLEGLQMSTRMQQLRLGAIDNMALENHLRKQAERSVDAIAKELGFGEEFYSMNPNIVETVINQQWADGKNFSERIWNNREKLANYLNDDFAKGIARGDSCEKLIRTLRQRFDKTSRDDMYRLIYTEGTFIMNESMIKPFEEDFDEYRFSIADSRACDICTSLDEQKFRMQDRQPGINFPPMHAYCRCSFTIVIPDNFVEKYEQKYNRKAPKIVDKYAKYRYNKNSDKMLSQNINNNSLISIGGVDCTVTQNQYSFGDGTGGIRKTVNANIYETPDGTKFVFPDTYNKHHQTMTPEQAIANWQRVPQRIKQQAQKTIEIVDYYNPQDSYWRKHYKNFRHSYATGGDKITFYRYDSSHNDDYIVRTYCHEAGHFMDKKLAVGTEGSARFSSEPIWKKAMSDDRSVSGKKSCTKYGGNSNAEDFAESVAEYVKDKVRFANDFPNRAAILSSII